MPILNIPESKKSITKFIIVTQDFSGLGFCKMLLEGNTSRGNPREHREDTEVIMATKPKDTEDNMEAFNKVGEGMVDRMDLDEIFKNRKQYRDWLFVFDGNHNFEIADKLREEGYMVLGGQEFANKLEHDRNYAIQIIEKAGLDHPSSTEFDSKEEGMAFLDENFYKAYILKPDEPDSEIGWCTTCPENDNDEKANREIYEYLKSNKGEGTYILQERQKGVELNVEMWLYKGEPFFSFANLECKRKDNQDLGRMIGCAQDVGFIIPLHCKILNDTLWKLVKIPEFRDYTGMIDINVIVADNKYWFLEFCARFGYNSHPNLFLTLAISPMQEILSDMMTGNVSDFYKHFRHGFGASITAWIDKPVEGLPLMFDDDQDVASRFYHFDSYTEDGENYKLAGYANEVGIQCAHDYDLLSAAEECIKKISHVHYSGITHRTDLNKTDYLSNPEERLTACQEMHLFDE